MVHHSWCDLHCTHGGSPIFRTGWVHHPRLALFDWYRRVHRWKRHLLFLHALPGRQTLYGSCFKPWLCLWVHGWLFAADLPPYRAHGSIWLGHKLPPSSDLCQFIIVVVGLWYADVQVDSRTRDSIPHGMARHWSCHQSGLSASWSDLHGNQEIQSPRPLFIGLPFVLRRCQHHRQHGECVR